MDPKTFKSILWAMNRSKSYQEASQLHAERYNARPSVQWFVRMATRAADPKQRKRIKLAEKRMDTNAKKAVLRIIKKPGTGKYEKIASALKLTSSNSTHSALRRLNIKTTRPRRRR